MPKRVACRYYDPPGAWCAACRTGHPERCIDPLIKPDGWQPARPGPTDADEPAGASVPLGPLLFHSAGCAALGAGVTASTQGATLAGLGLIGLAFACGGAALLSLERESAR